MRCIKCRKRRRTKKGLCGRCRPVDLGNGFSLTTEGLKANK